MKRDVLRGSPEISVLAAKAVNAPLIWITGTSRPNKNYLLDKKTFIASLYILDETVIIRRR